MTIIVNVSDAKVSRDPDAVIATYSLGSCIGVSLYDPVVKVAGMLHYQLPSGSMDADRARQNPTMFGDTGMAYLLDEMAKMGAVKKRMRVGLAGAAQMLNDTKVFDIGRRNHTQIRKILWQHGMFIAGEQVGGKIPRTMFLRVSDGQMTIKAQDQTITL